MAHTLTEVATFDPTVTVPDGTDSRAHAAEDVAAIGQALANRSQYLKAQTDVSARTNVSNTFTASNAFQAVTATSLTVSGTTTLNGNVTAADGTVDVASGLSVSGTATLNGNVTAADGTLNITGDVATTGALSIAGDLTITDITKDVKYPTTGSLPIRNVNIPMFDGKSISGSATYDASTGGDNWKPSSGTCIIRFPVHGLPRGAPAVAFEVVWRAHDVSVANSAQLYLNAQAAWSSTAGDLVTPSTPTSILTVTQTVGFSATQCTKSTFFLPISHTVNNAGEAFYIDVTLQGGPNNQLYGLRCFYLDPGARNG
jgi:hypothetical protein